jgi:hypothetical protein
MPAPNTPNFHPWDRDTKAPSRWLGVIDPGQAPPPLNAGEKMVFWLHSEVNPLGAATTIVNAGYEQLVNGDPKYGSDSGAFGERVGALFLRDASMRFFALSVMPTVTREDPRYYRKGTGKVMRRAVYAASRVLITRYDSGLNGFNFSETIGRLGGAALTTTYYPSPSVTTDVVLETWGISLAGSAGNNLFLEFWPDIRDSLFHHHHTQP